MDGECTFIIYCERVFSNTIEHVALAKFFPETRTHTPTFLPLLMCVCPVFAAVLYKHHSIFSQCSTIFFLHLFLHTVLLGSDNKWKVSRICLSFVSGIEVQLSLWAQRSIFTGRFILCSKRAFSDSLDAVDLENFSVGKPPDPFFLLLWSAVATGLPCLVQYLELHASISKRLGVITCVAWA